MSARAPQPGLFESCEVRESFRRYLADNPQVYFLFERFTLEAISRGVEKIGAKAVVERMRWETMTSEQNGDYKLNNNWTAHLAREFARRNPRHADCFETRRSKADL